MKFDPKLKNAMEEIAAIINKYDIAGNVILSSPGFGEYRYFISPSYSCAAIEHLPQGDAVRVRAKAADLGVEQRNLMLTNTANMLNVLTEVTGRTFMDLDSVSQQVDKAIQAEHGGLGFSHDREQQN